MRNFRFEWFDELDRHEYETPNGFRVFSRKGWVKAPRSFRLLTHIVTEDRETGESFLKIVNESTFSSFLVPYDERGFVLLAPPEGYIIETAFPSNPPPWLQRIRGDLQDQKKSFWERL